MRETQITTGPGGRILTNTGVWSPDGQWIVYDTRSDPAGDRFDGTRIEMVNVETREVRVLYESQNGACCGVATWHPHEPKVAFILGPEHPTADWTYGAARRQGVIVDARQPGVAVNLDARDLLPPFTPGALRGGSHVHVWHPRGDWISFTYEDHVLSRFAEETAGNDVNRRNVGVAIPRPVRVNRGHARNHDGEFFSVLVTKTVGRPTPGSDEISKAFEDAWIGGEGRAIAFQGLVTTTEGREIAEVFVADLPGDLTVAGTGPLEGTETRMPAPPAGVMQRRLTYTADRKFPGLQGPRHWLRSSPDGSRIGCLMKDDDGIVQFWTVSPSGRPVVQVTRNRESVASAFTWHPSGRRVAFVMDSSICVADIEMGETRRLTERSDGVIRPEACVFSPDGRRVAFVREVDGNQICVVESGISINHG